MVDIAPVQKPLKLSGGQTIQTFHFNDPSTAAAESGRRKATLPILMVNGGPGMSHRYLISLARRLSINRNRRVILYDQSGCGDSDASTDSREWTIARYVRELHEVIEKLHLGKFILYGHSWGGFLALEYGTSQYMMRPSPRNDASTNMKSMVEALIISNATAGTAEYEKYANILLQAVEPLPVRVRILELEAGGEHDNPEYQDLLLRYVYTKHLLRLPVEDWPPEIVSAFESKNEAIYRHLWGPSEFKVTGAFKQWSLWDELPQIPCSTLVIVGRHDTMNPEDATRMAQLIPKGEVFCCPKGSHCSFIDDEKNHDSALFDFIQRMDRK